MRLSQSRTRPEEGAEAARHGVVGSVEEVGGRRAKSRQRR